MNHSAAAWVTLQRLRETVPLVQNITNYVVMNNTANALLAVGASPAMVHAVEEVEEFVALAQALVINIGTLSPAWVEGMRTAARQARALARPWALDPVGAGATRYRTHVALELLRLQPTVVRGNASEILALAQAGAVAIKGVDSSHSSEQAVNAARALAEAHGCVVAVTGAVDYITDGRRMLRVANGHPLMSRVTGLGCTATALVGAFLACNDSPLLAAAQALAVLGVAGEIAAGGAHGPGSLQMRLLDALYELDEPTLTTRAHISEEHDHAAPEDPHATII
jgi:hydroxyethylthiazole kinase